ncbi:M20/M25/M40 family metallo-hydrolase [Candidatus Micrarchaeota archaeon]|nr:M20/M25/M40 family metallo-hydrolase [Candidatus Micrarchaeota archaeon]
MDAIEHLGNMVAIPSEFPNESAMGEYCIGHLRRLGFEVSVVELEGGRPNIVARRGENPSLAFFGHLDTVPAYGEWSSNPHELTERDGKLYGLGASDMKGGIAAFLSAIEATAEPVCVVLTSDEENDSAGAYLLSSRPELFGGIRFMVSAEPIEHGEQEGSIMLGRRGRAVYRVDVRGISSHGAHVEQGISAIEKASELVLALREFPLKRGTPLGDGSMFVREISGANTSLSLPENAWFQIDAHLVSGENAESMRGGLESFLRSRYRDCSVSIFDRGLPYNMPHYTPPENAGVGALKQAVELVVGTSSYCVGKSVADDNVFGQLFPVASYGPIGRNYHSADEYVEKSSLLNCGRVYAELIGNWGARS